WTGRGHGDQSRQGHDCGDDRGPHHPLTVFTLLNPPLCAPSGAHFSFWELSRAFQPPASYVAVGQQSKNFRETKLSATAMGGRAASFVILRARRQLAARQLRRDRRRHPEMTHQRERPQWWRYPIGGKPPGGEQRGKSCDHQRQQESECPPAT